MNLSLPDLNIYQSLGTNLPNTSASDLPLPLGPTMDEKPHCFVSEHKPVAETGGPHVWIRDTSKESSKWRLKWESFI